jgi:hypothetical protein
MQFYEPGPFEEFVGKLSSFSAKPSPEAWDNISKKLDNIDSHRRWGVFKRLSVAASILIVISLGSSFFIVNHSTYQSSIFSNWDKNDVKFVTNPANNKIIDSQPIPDPTIIPKIQQSVPVIAIDSNISSVSENEPEGLLQPITRKELIVKNSATNISNQNSFSSKIELEPIAPFQNEAFSSDAKDEEKGVSPWSLVAYLNPTYSSQPVSSMSHGVLPAESKSWMVGGEVMVKREIGSFFSIYSGVFFSPTGFNMGELAQLDFGSTEQVIESSLPNKSPESGTNNNSEFLSSVSRNNRSSSLFTRSPVESAELQQRYYYMEVPLIVSTSFKRGFVNVEVKLGCSAGILIDNKFEVIRTDESYIGQTEEIRPHNAALLGAISFSVPISNKVNLIVEPSIKYHLFPLSYSYTASYPVASSVKFGMGYRF